MTEVIRPQTCEHALLQKNEEIVDIDYCMNSYLQYRTIVDPCRQFAKGLEQWRYRPTTERIAVNTAMELQKVLAESVTQTLQTGNCALMLSSGIDSAILARLLPSGTKAYTLQCLSDRGINEVSGAARYAKINGLDHTVVQVTWKDYQETALPLMCRKGCPIHPLEVQVLKAARQAKADGIDTLIFGETADIIFGGHSKLLARDWRLKEFQHRFAFVPPERVLRRPKRIDSPILPYVKPNGYVDVPGFLNGFEYPVSLGFYHNACDYANIRCVTPYAHTILGHRLNLERIRSGEGKYLVRELYVQLYPNLPVPEKTPLPRPMGEWLQTWEGPKHPLMLQNNIQELTGDQKWYVYALDQFLRYVVER